MSSRARISTTVDADRLSAARSLFHGSDSQLIDRALEVLVRRLSAEHERAALTERPYADDPELSWTTASPSGDAVPYDAPVPDHLEHAADQHARYDDGPR